METSDDHLMQRTATGDRQAAAMLMHRHLPCVMSVASRMTGNRQDAEDVAQDVFMKVWKAAPGWTIGKAAFPTWLHTVTINRCRDGFRKRREQTFADPPEIRDEADTPEDALRTRQTDARVRGALARLPDRQRAALVLSHYEGLGNEETARIIGISIRAVESLLARARRSLKADFASDPYFSDRHA